MDITGKNGQPSMEEILASIRRIIAEEPAGATQAIDFNRRPIMLPQGEGETEDGPEFDLPAIFRPAPPPSEKPTPLFGRLTDAIRNATTQVIEPKPQASVGESLPALVAVEAPELVSPNLGLSTLKLASADPDSSSSSGAVQGAPASVYEGQVGSGAQTADPGDIRMSQGASTKESVQRVMAPFKDTRFLRMVEAGVFNPGTASAVHAVASEPAADRTEVATVVSTPAVDANAAGVPAPIRVAETATVIVPEPLKEPSGAQLPPVVDVTAQPVRLIPVDFAAIVPQRLGGEPGTSAPRTGGEAPAPVASSPRNEPAALSPPPLQATARPDAADEDAGGPVGSIEDATADLLRPMLRQWLAENMPRMVEKALHIEVAQSVKAGRKPPQDT